MSCWTRSNAPAKTGTNDGSSAASPDPRIPRARWADSTMSNSRWRIGTSWRVIDSIRLATYGTRSRAERREEVARVGGQEDRQGHRLDRDQSPDQRQPADRPLRVQRERTELGDRGAATRADRRRERLDDEDRRGHGHEDGQDPDHPRPDPGAHRDEQTQHRDRVQRDRVERRERHDDDGQQPGQLHERVEPVEPRRPPLGGEDRPDGTRHRAPRTSATSSSTVSTASRPARPGNAIDSWVICGGVRRVDDARPRSDSTVRGRPIRDDATGIEDDDPIGDVGDQRHVVRDGDDGRSRGAHVPDDAGDAIRRPVVLAGRRLVEDEDAVSASSGRSRC